MFGVLRGIGTGARSRIPRVPGLERQSIAEALRADDGGRLNFRGSRRSRDTEVYLLVEVVWYSFGSAYFLPEFAKEAS